ncbi:hypothetical protein ABBQ32_008825 [Trebouxia sp. C0010 RCD-2024]
MLTETQTPALLCQQLSGYSVHTIPATSTGKAGEDALLAFRQTLPYSTSHWQTDQANNTIWLTLKPTQSRQQSLTLGFCYVPPESSRSAQLSCRSATIRFDFPRRALIECHSFWPCPAAQTAGLRRKRPYQPAMLSYYPWCISRCANLRSQLRLAKQAAPRSPQVRLLGHHDQAVLRHGRTQHNLH